MANKKLKVGNVPNLRFPGFTEEWETKKLQDVVKINQGLQIMISERLIEAEDGAHFYITNEFLKKSSEKKYFIKNAPSSVLCTEEDILMTRTGNTGMVVTNVSGAFHNNFFKVAYPETIVKGFLYNFLKLPDTQKQIIRLAGTSTIPDLNHSDFYNIKFTFPKKTEQSKIAHFVAVIDERIQTQNKIIEELKLLKNTLSKKIFIRQFRFKNEKGNDFPEWQNTRLGDIGQVITGKTPSTKDLDLWDGDIQFVTPTDISENKYQYSTERTIKKTENLKILPPKSIMFTCIASIGKMSLSLKPCVTNQQINSIIPSSDFNNELVFYAVANISEFIKSTQSSSTMPIINKTEFSKFEISVPSLEEQTKIANFLSSIDSKIDIEIRFQQKLEEQKKFLLQNLFV